MTRLAPVHYRKFERFLLSVGCRFVRQKGDHRIYVKEGLPRPLVVPAVKYKYQFFIIRNNLRLLNISIEEYCSFMSKR